MVFIAIIATLSMVATTITQQASAAPKDQNFNSHCKTTYDPDTGNFDYKCGSNSNGPSGHQNCKNSYDSTDGYDSRCINN